MSLATRLDASVTLCDLQGHLLWTSFDEPTGEIGDFVWDFAHHDDADLIKSSFSRAVALREPQYYEARDKRARCYRVWMWPLQLSEAAICILAFPVPNEIRTLTARERDCLHLLAEGQSTTEIAKALDVSLSTVHTHLKHIRDKLKLRNVEQLICFAARYDAITCQPQALPHSSRQVEEFD